MILLCSSTSLWAATISGTVYLEGNPLPDSSVLLYTVDAAGNTQDVARETKTDALGAYRLNSPEGQFALAVVSSPRLGLLPKLVDRVDVTQTDLRYQVVLL